MSAPFTVQHMYANRDDLNFVSHHEAGCELRAGPAGGLTGLQCSCGGAERALQEKRRVLVAGVIDGMACKYFDDQPADQREPNGHGGHDLLISERHKAFRRADEILALLKALNGGAP